MYVNTIRYKDEITDRRKRQEDVSRWTKHGFIINIAYFSYTIRQPYYLKIEFLFHEDS